MDSASNQNKYDSLYKQIPESLPTKAELAYFSSTGTNELLCNISNRRIAQGDISKAQAAKTEILSDDEIIRNVQKTLKGKARLQSQLSAIEEKIQKIKEIEKTATGAYWFHLEQNLPNIETRYENIKKEIDTRYKQSNTHINLSKEEKEKVAIRRWEIGAELNKFIEDLREYI